MKSCQENRLLLAATKRICLRMRDSRFPDLPPLSKKDGPSTIRLSLLALALIAGGLFVMMQDDSRAESPPQPLVQASR